MPTFVAWCLLVGCDVGGFYHSGDGGRTWTSMNGTGLTCRHVVQIVIDPHNPDRLYLCTSGNGAFVGEVGERD